MLLARCLIASACVSVGWGASPMRRDGAVVSADGNVKVESVVDVEGRSAFVMGDNDSRTDEATREAECPDSSQFVRAEVHGTCESQGYTTIGDLSTCTQAFDECAMTTKRTTNYETIDSVSYTFLYNGCQSTCLSSYAGHFCRTFNSAKCASENCTGHANYARDAHFLCEKTSPTADADEEAAINLPDATLDGNHEGGDEDDATEEITPNKTVTTEEFGKLVEGDEDAFDCDAGLAKWETGWSAYKISWCCNNKHKGCAEPEPTSYTKTSCNHCKCSGANKGKEKKESRELCEQDALADGDGFYSWTSAEGGWCFRGPKCANIKEGTSWNWKTYLSSETPHQ